MLDQASLLDALAAVERPFLLESSVKVIGGKMRADRVLISFPRCALGPGPRRRLRDICAGLDAPALGFDQLDRYQGSAISVHFGFEPEKCGPMFKCYLEFSPMDQPTQNVVFLALKWQPGHGGDGDFVLSRYSSRDHLCPARQSSLVEEVVPHGPGRETFCRLLEMAPGGDALRLLEVDELGGPRRSLDLNVAQAELRLGELTGLLAPVMGGTPAGADYLAAHADERLGHFAAGVARDGKPFATIYHGAHRIHAGQDQ